MWISIACDLLRMVWLLPRTSKTTTANRKQLKFILTGLNGLMVEYCQSQPSRFILLP